MRINKHPGETNIKRSKDFFIGQPFKVLNTTSCHFLLIFPPKQYRFLHNFATTRKLILLLILWIGCLSLGAQKNSLNIIVDKNSYDPIFNPVAVPAFGTSRDFLPVSPTAGSLGVYGQIPVGNYTGTAEISIPLYEVKHKELSVPISLNYHASGIKPELFPGPVGIGWSLQAGGCISRVVNGYPDKGDYPGDGTHLSIDYRVYDDWSNVNLLESYIDNTTLAFSNDSEPDEYYFNINGQTGKFYVDHTDTFRIQSVQGNSYLIVMDPVETRKFTFAELKQNRKDEDIKYLEHIYSNAIRLYRVITGFTMIDDKGIKYKFGGSERAIEFSRPGLMEYFWNPESYIRPMSWFLTSIESPNGYKIDLRYNQHTTLTRSYFSDVILFKHSSTDKFNKCPFEAASDHYNKSTMINGCYLTEIKFPNGKVVFDNSKANEQLDFGYYFKYDSIPGFNYVKFQFYSDVGRADTEKTNDGISDFAPHKTDAIHVLDNTGEEKRSISFKYTSDPEKRHRLRMYALSIGLGQEKKEYRFGYNDQNLPPYTSRQTDYYGYYNGVYPYSEPGSDSLSFYIEEHPDYLNKIKAPDFEYAKAEILEKITYPTGGYTLFEYEPHEYGCQVRTWPFETITNPDGNRISAGVRIKSVSNYDRNGTLLTRKGYHYVKNYLTGGTESSGVLAYTPQFCETYADKKIKYGNEIVGLNYFFRFSSNPIFPLCSTRGNHVTYSEVTVEEAKSGFTTYKYSNYDNGYGDRELLGFISNDMYNTSDSSTDKPFDFRPQTEGISMDLERGLLLSQSIFDRNKKLKKQIVNTYNDDPKRFDEHVRYFRYEPVSLNLAEIRFHTLSAGLYYTYFPYLKRKVETEYLDNPRTTTVEYIYDTRYRLMKQKTIKGGGADELKSILYYPYEFASENDTYRQMTARRMLANPVKEVTQCGIYSTTQIREYDKGLAPENPELILLRTESLQTESAPLRTQVTYSRYDKEGNPVEVDYLSEGKVCYVWSYSKEHPVAKIEGVDFETVRNKLGDPFIRSITENTIPYDMDEDIESIRTRLSGLEALVSTYTYIPLVGVKTVTQPNGSKVTYIYDSLGRLIAIKDMNGSVIESYLYHYGR